MADQELIKHLKRAYKLWNIKERNVWRKIKELFIEIFIIVFSFTLSIYLNQVNEHKHDQENVKTFLLGLKSDLQSDIIEMKSDLDSYQRQKGAFAYLSSVKLSEKVSFDTIRVHEGWVFSTTNLVTNDGRYEGFKSSGNIDKIENVNLRNKILDLYQEDLQSLFLSTEAYINAKRELLKTVLINKKRKSDSTSNILDVFKLEIVYNYSRYLRETEQIEDRYGNCINKMKEIVDLIEKEYN